MSEPSAPLISVLVPVYNVETTLRPCLDSICAQTYPNLEILCVNDGSTDSSPAILAEYAAKDPRITVIHQANAGLSAARNTALDHAHGHWIAAVDSDDYLEPDTYATCLSHLTTPADLVCFGVKVEGSPNLRREQQYFDIIPQLAAQNNTQPMTLELEARLPDPVWNKLMRRDLIEQHHLRFPDGLWYEDFCFSHMYYCMCQSVCLVPKQLYHYVRHEKSIIGMSLKGHPKAMHRIQVLDQVLQYYRQHGHWETKQPLIRTFLVLLDTMMRQVPPNMRAEAHLAARDFLHRNQLDQTLAGDPLVHEFMTPRWLNQLTHLFYRRKAGSTTYRFLGIPLLRINTTPGKHPYRILGIPIGKPRA